jgi:hypothetical protein
MPRLAESEPFERLEDMSPMERWAYLARLRRLHRVKLRRQIMITRPGIAGTQALGGK